MDDYNDECKTCNLPDLLHRGACTRKARADAKEGYRIQKEYSDMIKPIVVGMKRRRSLEDQQNNLTKGLLDLIDTMHYRFYTLDSVQQEGQGVLIPPLKSVQNSNTILRAMFVVDTTLYGYIWVYRGEYGYAKVDKWKIGKI